MKQDYLEKSVLMGLAVVLFVILVFFVSKKKQANIYTDMACPVCGAHKVALIKKDSIMGRADFKCYSCEKHFYLTEAAE